MGDTENLRKFLRITPEEVTRHMLCKRLRLESGTASAQGYAPVHEYYLWCDDHAEQVGTSARVRQTAKGYNRRG